MFGQYRILQKDFDDGRTVYVLERLSFDGKTWNSCYAHADLEIIREAKAKKESAVVSQKVIE